MPCAMSCAASPLQAGWPEVGAPMYSIPGAGQPAAVAPAAAVARAAAAGTEAARTVGEVLAQSQAAAVLEDLDRDLVGLVPIKARIRDIAALLVIDRLRANLGIQAQ